MHNRGTFCLPPISLVSRVLVFEHRVNAHNMRQLAVFGRNARHLLIGTSQDPPAIAYARVHPRGQRRLCDERYLVSVQRIVHDRVKECLRVVGFLVSSEHRWRSLSCGQLTRNELVRTEPGNDQHVGAPFVHPPVGLVELSCADQWIAFGYRLPAHAALCMAKPRTRRHGEGEPANSTSRRRCRSRAVRGREPREGLSDFVPRITALGQER